MKKINNLSIIFLILVFIGCGGSSSQEKSSNEQDNGNGSSQEKSSVKKEQNKPVKSAVLQKLEQEPYYKYSWHINEDNIFDTKNAHINILPVWEETLKDTQSRSFAEKIKIAIIDDSFNEFHEDYKANIIAKCNFDSYTPPIGNSDYTNNILNYCKNNQDVSPDYRGAFSHGTTVAGVLSSGLNKKGGIGIAPENNLILIKQFSPIVSQTLAAFEYAALMGAKVINCSWGTENVSEAVANKIKELKEKNINVVFASGNGDNNGIARNLDANNFYDESELDSVIGVGATSELNDVTSYSNYGRSIDVLAPGGEYIGVLGAFVLNSEKYPNNFGQAIDTTNYSFELGTSFSAPIVSGTIALLLNINPYLSAEQIRTILIETADKVGNASYVDRLDDNTTSTFNERRAYGKINVYKAYKRAKQLIK